GEQSYLVAFCAPDTACFAARDILHVPGLSVFFGCGAGGAARSSKCFRLRDRMVSLCGAFAVYDYCAWPSLQDQTGSNQQPEASDCPFPDNAGDACLLYSCRAEDARERCLGCLLDIPI